MIRKNADDLITKLDSHGFKADQNINLGKELTELAELYQKGTIFYKEYRKGAVPEEAELRQDLLNMLAIYNQYIAKVVEANKDFVIKEVSFRKWVKNLIKT